MKKDFIPGVVTGVEVLLCRWGAAFVAHRPGPVRLDTQSGHGLGSPILHELGGYFFFGNNFAHFLSFL